MTSLPTTDPLDMSETASDDFIMVQDTQYNEEEEEQEDEVVGSDDSIGHASTSNLLKEDFRAKRAPIKRHGVACKLCLEEIRGERWMCVNCVEWNLCSICFHGVSDDVHPLHTFVRVQSASDIHTPTLGTPIIHLDVVCSSCQLSILGSRYECIADECDNEINLCQNCESLPLQSHKSSHPMIKYKIRKESNAKSTIIDYGQLKQQKSGNLFGISNRPIQISNKGLWELSDQVVITEKVMNARKELSMEIEKDKETPWGSHLSPNTTFSRSWDIVNCGTRAWPKGIFVTRISSAIFTPLHFKKRIVSDDVVRKGKTIEVRFVGLTAPEAPRTYMEVWALCDSEDRFFGERLEIRICVGEKDEHASDRYFGLEEALSPIKEAKEDLEREKQGAGALEPCKMTVLSSTLQWNAKQQSLTCTWNIANTSKVKFPIGCQLRRTRQTVGNCLFIDDSEATISIPQGLAPAHDGTIMVSDLKVISIPENNQSQSKEIKTAETSTQNISNWFTDTWKLVDAFGTEFGENLYFAQNFTSTDLKFDDKRRELLSTGLESKRQLLQPQGEWKGKGDWLYRSSIDQNL